jgi:dihydrofolate reductase
MFAEFDTFVMGRKTWDVSAAADATDMGMSDMFAGKKVVVFSRTLKSARPGVTIVDTDPAETVRALKRKPGKDIWLFGGGSMFRTLVDAGLVDTVEVGIMPVLLSQGVPLLAPGARITGMKLDKCETLPKSGIVMLSYTIPDK